MISSIRRALFATGRGTTLGNLFDRLADLHGDRRAAEQSDGVTFTYNSARETVARWSARVFDEVPRGGRVVVAMANGYEQLLACVAVARGGGIPVPVNDRMSPDEIDHVIADSDAELVIWSSREFAGYGELHEAVPAEASDVAAIFYTSGTTGRPKGARLSHRALLGSLAVGALWPSRIRRDEAIVGLPVAHIMGFVVLIGLGVAGIPVYELARFDEHEVLDAIEQRRATIFVGVPAMYRMMLDAGAATRDLRSIRIWASGADAMPPDMARQFQRMGASVTFPFVHASVGEAAFLEGWGMVETGGAAVTRLALPFVGGPAWPMPGYHLRVDDPDGDGIGELLVRGPGVLEGYHGNPGATAAVLDGGWLHTGDLARRGRFGTVNFEGRTKDVVKSGGYSVFAAEVERVLAEHPAVAEAAVFGAPDKRLGEVPAAAVRLQPGSTATQDELIDFVRQRLATYKAPRRIIVVPELPRGGTGKVQKDRLRDLVG